ncbi:unnamed protein product [Cryptosporidium hominis]|uniref:Uncharacterized protein n=2 Tax=Cryptosporidium hominis TaxID=237895 RepID=A0A0S4TBS7_CRYHO|nr:hypothetical protein ChTU502y2012_305g0270 [Cryptosporidium hominis]PPA63409.1 hypothetical protein ChUKH1_07705 [Cryptosporidium hominis]PPS97312.1 Uncharacterized protein GY17_00001186 [Cryptosporidium hominis]CUV04123.1 unnamed protein product [Cryptosporidium hominis]|eukprot:PPS97312.1 Uncharacterized protein GY17_00001186 [Cryptosporidium hominis]
MENEKMKDQENEIQAEEKESLDSSIRSFENKPIYSDKSRELQDHEKNDNCSGESCKVNSKQIAQNCNIINEKTNSFDMDNRNSQNITDLYLDNKTIITEKSEKNGNAEFDLTNNQSYFKDLDNLIEKDDDKTQKSAQKLEKISQTEEMFSNNKNKIKMEYKVNLKDRKGEIKELLDNINKLKSKASQNETCIVAKLMNSRGVYCGMHTELSLYEELLKYLFSKRDLNEETFESIDIEDNVSLVDQSESNTNNLFHLEIENTETYTKRKSVFENIIDFAAKKVSIYKNYSNIFEKPKKNFENEHLKPLSVHYDLSNHDSVTFFEDTIICDENFNNFFSPFNVNDAYLSLSSKYLNLKINQIQKEIDILSSYLTKKECQIFEKSIEFNFSIKNFGINLFNLFENNLFGLIINERFDEKNEFKSKTNLKGINSNNILVYKMNFCGIRYLKENWMNNLFRKKLQVIQHRLDSLCKFLLPREEISQEFKKKSIVNRLINVENMLLSIIPKSHSVADIFQTKIQMESNLLNGFIISDVRKSDLKKISNLVKSKVSSYGGRNSKFENEGYDIEINDNELYKTEENKKIKSMLEELDAIRNKKSSLWFDDIFNTASRLVRKENTIESFLSNVKRIEKCEKMHAENLVSLEKIQGITNKLLEIMETNLNKVDELNIDNISGKLQEAN